MIQARVQADVPAAPEPGPMAFWQRCAKFMAKARDAIESLFRTGTLTERPGADQAKGQLFLATDAVGGGLAWSDGTTWSAIGTDLRSIGNGTVGAPSIAFAAQQTDGFFHPANGQVSVAIAGVENTRFIANEIEIPQILRFLANPGDAISNSNPGQVTLYAGGVVALRLAAIQSDFAPKIAFAAEVTTFFNNVSAGRIDVALLGTVVWSWLQTLYQFKHHAAFTGSELKIATVAVRTTNATQTTLFAFTLLDNTSYCFWAKVIGRDEAGSDFAFYVRAVFARRQSASAAGLSTIQSIVTDETNAAMDCTFTASVNDVRVSVTGIVAKNISWVGAVEWQAVSTST